MTLIKWYRAPILSAGLVLLIQGCGTPVHYPPRDTRQPPPVIEQSVPAPAPQPPPQVGMPQPVPPAVTKEQSPAVVALLDTAEQQANAGDLEAASASLERAIRIDPRNALLWHHLATVRLSQGDAPAAEQLAVKSNSLAPGNTVQQSRNWQLIARARRAQNNQQGAAIADQRARELAERK
jgi:cytochrome c-type biogenesis protein CcmH/NrfG